jgi:hypothetical protein
VPIASIVTRTPGKCREASILGRATISFSLSSTFS